MSHPRLSDNWRQILLCSLAAALPLLACGPQFPNHLLAPEGSSLTSAPIAEFARELDRLQLTPPAHLAVLPTESQEQQTYDAELSDLGMALTERHHTEPDLKRLLEQMSRRRQGLSQATQGLDATRISLTNSNTLPAEFRDYLTGAYEWHAGRRGEARTLWKDLLSRPASERRFRSTWAAYMLGRSAETNEWEDAIARYRQVRALAKEGFVDTLGLAAASYGWEAQVQLRRKAFPEALELYLAHYASGNHDNISLQETVRRAIAHGTPDQVLAMAKNESMRGTVGAWLISRGHFSEEGFNDSETRQSCTKRWLAAVELAGVRDLPTAERLALAAYQAGEMEVAIRWIKRAPMSPTIQWLNAKLWLRAGRTDRAAEVLARIVNAFPLSTSGTLPTDHVMDLRLESGLLVEDGGGGTIPASREILGELGVLHLARREYRQSLDALLRANFWMDAAYVAERVLTVHELKSYVDREWPDPEPIPPGEVAPIAGSEEGLIRVRAQQIRALLGRRLVRVGRANEASPYLAEDCRPGIAKLVESLQRGRDESLTAAERAAAWWQAATVTRSQGMELLGTEGAPDWAAYGGNFESGVSIADRESTNALARASLDELRRGREHRPEPDNRFHYRYIAASMAWEAASLMPNNDLETAQVLCRAGSWLKARDPATADVFYKSLVRRCRKTSIGKQADEMRWFPDLDDVGNPVPWQKSSKQPSEPEIPDEVEPAVDANAHTGPP